MTLILTALCKKGICVCADKKNRTWDGGQKRHEDNLNKIYNFKDIPLIIFNHGINKFSGKPWNELCSEYKKSGRWKGKGLIQIADDFKDFAEGDIYAELKRNEKNKQLMDSPDFNNTVGFVLCGKGSGDSKFKVKEFYWSLDSNKKLHCKPKRHKGGLVRTGIGAKCLEEYIKQNEDGRLATISYWKKMKIVDAKKELERLFNIAVVEQKRRGKNDFSDTPDTKCINEKHST